MSAKTKTRLYTGTKHHIDRRADAIASSAAPGSADELLNTPDLAKWLGVSTQWLEIGRSKGYGPKFETLSPQLIRYRRGNVIKWLNERTFASTAEYGKKRRAKAVA